MPIDLYRNSNVYNMIAEGEIAQILSKFSTEYIMDVIDSNIRNRFSYNPSLSNPNIINSYEMNFKGMLSSFPNDADNIMSIRQDTYLTIINKICSSFNLQYIGDQPDCYTLAYNLYDLFVSGYSRNIINFFARYIYIHGNEIYHNMGLDKYKKSKDSTTNYMRKVLDDSRNIEAAVYIARIKDVIYYISGFDIDFYTFLSFNYPKEVCDFLYSNIAPMGNIFKDEFCNVLNSPSILTEIRIAIQNLLIQNMSQNVPQQDEQPLEPDEDNIDNEGEE